MLGTEFTIIKSFSLPLLSVSESLATERECRDRLPHWRNARGLGSDRLPVGDWHSFERPVLIRAAGWQVYTLDVLPNEIGAGIARACAQRGIPLRTHL